MKPKLIEGNNRLHICPATVQSVMQAWLDEEMSSPVDVVAVEYEGNGGMFVVKFKRKLEETAT